MHSSLLSLLHGIKFNLSLCLFGGIGLRVQVGRRVTLPQPICLERDGEETAALGGEESKCDVTCRIGKQSESYVFKMVPP